MSKLAINGGEQVINRSLGKSWPICDEREEKALLDVLHSGMWWRGSERLKARHNGQAVAPPRFWT